METLRFAQTISGIYMQLLIFLNLKFRRVWKLLYNHYYYLKCKKKIFVKNQMLIIFLVIFFLGVELFLTIYYFRWKWPNYETTGHYWRILEWDLFFFSLSFTGNVCLYWTYKLVHFSDVVCALLECIFHIKITVL